ncbi:AAC(3) family N-acetyltransferase [Streptomyces sp. NPDC057638]|uniref:AAC(3) family N-acetyltransferase n=1 Tax=Streptomyces sp. NPDC057638 TaxID=3346190 RepID=UPI0036CE78E5
MDEGQDRSGEAVVDEGRDGPGAPVVNEAQEESGGPVTVRGERLARAVEALGLSGRPVLVHASLRSFGAPLDGGADSLVDALLGAGCTVLVPAFTEPWHSVPPPASDRPARNGLDYTLPYREAGHALSTPYAPDCGLVNPSLGVLPVTVVARPGTRRGRHPLNSFAALGPEAAALIDGQDPGDVYAPLRALAERGGRTLLIGVGLNRMTTLHLAEQRSGRRLFRRWARLDDGRIATVEVGSCSEGFPRLEPWLRPHARTTIVHGSRWHAYPVPEVLATIAPALAAAPTLTRCSADCRACADATAGGPVDAYPGTGVVLPG